MEPPGFSEQVVRLKTSIDRLRKGVNEELDNLSAALDKLSTECHNTTENQPVYKEIHLRKKSDGGSELPEKMFQLRNSRIVDMMANQHLRTVFNMCAAFLFLVCVILVISYIYDPQRVHEDLSTIILNSAGFSTVIGFLLAINFSILFLLRPSLHLWAQCRTTVKSGLLDGIFLSLLVIYIAVLLAFPAYYSLKHGFPPLSAAILAFEQVRLIMKLYAYTRELVKVNKHVLMKETNGTNNIELKLPEMNSLLYFLFAPTLVFRESYPRTPNVRWGTVLWYLSNFLGCILLYSVVLNHFIKDLFRDAGKDDFQLLGFTLTGCSILILGSISLFLMFYGFLHCWLNLFAELLRFGDRLFYLDWWNSTTYADYYRSWNLVVHDWLFTYVYTDAYKIFNRSKRAAMLVVFMLSAIVHEYILAVAYGFFFPVILVVFGTLGVGFVFVTKKKTGHVWNVFLWITLIAGWGIILVFYTVEFYARLNCPQTRGNIADFFLPRSFSWSCHTFSHSIWFSLPHYRTKIPVP
ncbi:sterol O-acyltransferase 1-like [Ornithodoros turicata]|uniref:sterol O-acyltransferase 1-like n=1 Tax=Ornithodoros turicata TaxID=34597 RepID=UPI0031394BBF